MKLDKVYKELFEAKGYSDAVDVENLIGLDKKSLRDMGITRRGKQLYFHAKFFFMVCTLSITLAHVNQLLMHLKFLQYPSEGNQHNYLTTGKNYQDLKLFQV